MRPLHTLLIFALLLASSIFTGAASYSTTKADIEADLNETFAKTSATRKQFWLNADTIRTLRHLQADATGPVILSIPEPTIGQRMRHDSLADQVYLTMQLNPSAERNLHIVLQAHAHCSFATIYGLSHQWPSWLLSLLTLLWAAYSFHYFQRRKACQLRLDYVGNLGYHAAESRFYTTAGPAIVPLALTPLQHQLLQLLFRSPTHTLSKQAICDALWPKKPDASDTLYTLVRRLKPVLESATNLRIESERGRSYSLKAL